MSNSEIDLDTLTLPGSTREIFDPVSKGAWPGASSRVYVSTNRSGPESVIQIGYDPELDKTFVRASAGDETRWSDWVAVEAPPPEPEADAERKARTAKKAKDDDEEETAARSKKK